MLHFFRNIFKSKFGAALALIFLALIALAFAGGDLAGLRTSTGLGNADEVASVGNDGVDAALLRQTASSALEQAKQQQPNLTMKDLVREGALEQILKELIERTALAVFGKDHGVVAGDRLIDSEIATMPAFQGADGKFDEKVYRQAIAQRGMSEKLLRQDIAQGLVSRQLLMPVQFGAIMPVNMTKQYAAMLEERRMGSVAILPSLLFAPDKPPTDAELAAFYKAKSSNFIRPERRTIRYATFTDAALKTVPAPTDAEVVALYTKNKAQYAAQDRRKITQLIVPTEAAAKAVATEVTGGKSLEVAAREKGLTAAATEFFSREDLASQFSRAVSDAVFAAAKGQLAAPQKSPLGWHVIRVDETLNTPARSLADVRQELSDQLTTEKRRKALTDFYASIDDRFSSGASLADVAKDMGLTIQTTPQLTGDGSVYGKPGEKAADVLAPVLKNAFSMEEQQPEVAEVEPGKTFAIYDVARIEPSAPAPLAQIRDDVKLAWAVAKGSQNARAAAQRVQAEVRKGKPLEAALAALGKRLPPIENVGMTRPQLTAARQAGNQVPPPVTLMFSMARGSVKVQSAAQDRGWFVVQLKAIEPGKVDGSAPMIEAARRELGSAAGTEYASALRAAIVKGTTIKRNDKAIKAVSDQLGGTASSGN